MRHRLLCVAALVWQPVMASAQQRPLVTEDPETIGAGRMLVEAGVVLAAAAAAQMPQRR